MKIGIIYCSYGTLELTPESLIPWLTTRESRLGGNEYLIAAVSCPFSNFPGAKDDGTVEHLQNHLNKGKIDHLVTSSTPIPETEARGRALRWLVDNGADTLIQWDSDEIPTVKDISSILGFIEKNPLVPFFKFSLRNAVFDDKTFLKEPFTPARAHRVRAGSYVADSFWDDNNVLYRGTVTRDLKRDIDLCGKTIPRSVAYPTHLSWLDNDRSRKKCEYQEARSWRCSFRWNYDTGHLEWNPELPIPETETDS
jgi:hypothetical protein